MSYANKMLLALVMLLGFAMTGTVSAADRKPASNGYMTQKVVYHINDAEVAGAALRNIQNHLDAVGDENVSIVVVTHGKGIDFLLDGWKDSHGKSYEDPVHALANRGVKFDVCANTLKGRNIDQNKLNMNATIVPSGVATIAELEHQGYVYIKP